MLKSVKSFAVLAVMVGVMTGCSSNKAADNANESLDPSTQAGAGVSGSGVELSDTASIDNLDTTFYFEFDSAVLLPQGRAALTAHAEYLRNNTRSVRLEGHADERGSREYNMALGERRANAVRDFLALQGVSASRIETVSYGEERPAVSGSGDSVWSQNRRVELKYR